MLGEQRLHVKYVYDLLSLRDYGIPWKARLRNLNIFMEVLCGVLFGLFPLFSMFSCSIDHIYIFNLVLH